MELIRISDFTVLVKDIEVPVKLYRAAIRLRLFIPGTEPDTLYDLMIATRNAEGAEIISTTWCHNEFPNYTVVDIKINRVVAHYLGDR